MRAMIVEKAEDGTTSASVQEIDESRLPEGNVTVAVEYSTVNYKDGLCLGPGGGLVREDEESPHILLTETQAGYLFAIAQDDHAARPRDKEALVVAAVGAGRPVKAEVYDGDHGWTVPDSPAYAEAAAEQAYADLLELYSGQL